jgi:hypothetical protein
VEGRSGVLGLKALQVTTVAGGGQEWSPGAESFAGNYCSWWRAGVSPGTESYAGN